MLILHLHRLYSISGFDYLAFLNVDCHSGCCWGEGRCSHPENDTGTGARLSCQTLTGADNKLRSKNKKETPLQAQTERNTRP